MAKSSERSQSSPEQIAEGWKKRTISDADLLKGGASYLTRAGVWITIRLS